MSERDPKIDPKPGDRFTKGESIVTIVATGSGFGFTMCGRFKDAPPMPVWDEPWIPAFRKWAKDATLVERGEA